MRCFGITRSGFTLFSPEAAEPDLETRSSEKRRFCVFKPAENKEILQGLSLSDMLVRQLVVWRQACYFVPVE